MDKLFKQINERLPLMDAVKIGKYEELDNLSLETITKDPSDKDTILNGLLIYGYETKFADGTNTNGERYTKDCLDKFFAEYYGKNKLNMPFTIQHYNDLQNLAGRVLICEVNSVGFYFVCYVPRTYAHYEEVKNLIKEGILQGLSKEGWSTKGKCYYTKEGEFDYYLVEEMEMTAMSLVATPANGNPIEKAKEIKNTTRYNKKNADKTNAFAAMFNN
mgnify:CR=1 FL=1